MQNFNLFLIGKAGSGKSTLANYLKYNYESKVWHFADEIRDLIERVDPILFDGIHISDFRKFFSWDGLKNGGINKSALWDFLRLMSGKYDILSQYQLESYQDRMKKETRRLLQQFGEEFRGIAGNEVWVNRTFDKIDFHKDCNIIADMRRVYEANRSRLVKNGLIIRLNRNEEGLQDTKGAWRNHITETDLDNIKEDFTLQINGNIEKDITPLLHFLGLPLLAG